MVVGDLKGIFQVLEKIFGGEVFQTLIGTVKRRAGELKGGARGGVSNPHRYGQKRRDRHAGRHRGGPVSNPHRYGQKTPPWGYLFPPGPVSNPHRYGQKPHLRGLSLLRNLKFQTLIGTVKSAQEAESSMRVLAFQTLIGTVKRRGAERARVHGYQFQTLIGTVKS